MKTRRSLRDVKWSNYALDMRARFHDTEFTNPMSELVSLKQATSIEEYYKKVEALLNLLQLSNDYSLIVFVSNLKTDISKSVRLFHLKSLTQALNLVKQLQVLMYNMPRKPFIPYKPPLNQTPFYQNTFTLPQPQFGTASSNLPSLLPKPNLPIKPYGTTSKPFNPVNNKPIYQNP